jgi:hypothetical protein
VGNDEDGYLVFQLQAKLFDFGGGLRIKSRGRLIQQQDVWIIGQSPGDAEALLLATRKRESR